MNPFERLMQHTDNDGSFLGFMSALVKTLSDTLTFFNPQQANAATQPTAAPEPQVMRGKRQDRMPQDPVPRKAGPFASIAPQTQARGESPAQSPQPARGMPPVRPGDGSLMDPALKVLGVEYGPVEYRDKRGNPFAGIAPQPKPAQPQMAPAGAEPPTSIKDLIDRSEPSKEWVHDRRWGDWEESDYMAPDGSIDTATYPMGTMDDWLNVPIPNAATVGELATRINPEAWERFLAEAPKSANIEDRREYDPTMPPPPPPEPASTMDMLRDFWREQSLNGAQMGSVIPFPDQGRPATSGRPSGTQVFEGARQMRQPGSNVVPHPSREQFMGRAKRRLTDPEMEAVY